MCISSKYIIDVSSTPSHIMDTRLPNSILQAMYPNHKVQNWWPPPAQTQRLLPGLATYYIIGIINKAQ